MDSSICCRSLRTFNRLHIVGRNVQTLVRNRFGKPLHSNIVASNHVILIQAKASSKAQPCKSSSFGQVNGPVQKEVQETAGSAVSANALAEDLDLLGQKKSSSHKHRAHDTQKQQWVHFVGIGGTGLSALALVAIKQDWKVTGSDLSDSDVLLALREKGATAYVGHSAEHISDAALPDLVVVSSAVPADNPEVERARELGVRVCKRSEWLGLLTAPYKLLAVAGSHGKTSTSAMLAVVLRSLGKDVSAVIGGGVLQFPQEANALVGSSDLFVLEADEYDGAFLDVRPRMAVVTNVEWEHVDIFPDEESVRSIFRKFVQTVRPGGVLLLCNEHPGSQSLLDAYQDDRPSLRRQVFTYGLGPDSDFQAVQLERNSSGGSDFTATFCGRPLTDVSLKIAGVHSVLNALAVLALVALQTNEARPLSAQARLNTSVIEAARRASEALSSFQGVKRRFEFLGKVDGLDVYDDYAHHPTEVRATLQAARQKFPRKELWVVFQPHTFSRLAKLLPDFAPALAEADRVIVTGVYSARETNVFGVSGRDLVADIKTVPAMFIEHLEDVVHQLAADVQRRRYVGEPDVVLLNLGAGDITQVGPKLLERLAAKGP